MASPKNVVVIGGTGGVGRYVIQHASRKGHNVRALVRSKGKFDDAMAQVGMSAEELSGSGSAGEGASSVNSSGTACGKITVVEGNALKTEDVEKVVCDSWGGKGTDYVFSCLGNVRGEKDFIVESGTKCVLNAVEKLNDGILPEAANLVCFV